MHHFHDGGPAHHSARARNHVDRARVGAHRRSRQEYLRVCDLHGSRQGHSAHLARGRRQANRRCARYPAQLMTSRQGNLLGVAVCAGLLAYAYYAQVVLHLEPCPLCIFQRVGVFAIGLMFLIAAVHDPVGWARRVYASLLALSALATSGVAIRHLYIPSLPEGNVPALGASRDCMLNGVSMGVWSVNVVTV